MKNRLYLAGVILLLGMWGLASCNKDERNYEAEIEWLQFQMEGANGEVIAVQLDSLKQPSTTEPEVIALESMAELDRLQLAYELSPGATANIEPGAIVDGKQERIEFTVTAENGRNQRTYYLRLSKKEKVDFGTGGGPAKESGRELQNLHIKGVDCKVIAKGTRIFIEVPRGTDLHSLTLEFDLPKGATSDVASGTALDFSDGQEQHVSVTAENGSTRRYSIEVGYPVLQCGAEIEEFSFEGAEVSVEKVGPRIYVNVEKGKALTNLVAVIKLSKNAKLVGFDAANHDWSRERSITVVSEDGNAKSIYTVRTSQKKMQGAELESIVIEGINGTNMIVEGANYLFFTDNKQFDMKAVKANIRVSEGASVNWDGSAKNFKQEGTYVDGRYVYQLEVVSEDLASKSYYSIAIQQGNNGLDLFASRLTSLSMDVAAFAKLPAPVIVGSDIYIAVKPDMDLSQVMVSFTMSECDADKLIDAKYSEAGKKPLEFSLWLNDEDRIVEGETLFELKDGMALYLWRLDPNVTWAWSPEGTWMRRNTYTVHLVELAETYPPVLESFSFKEVSAAASIVGNRINVPVGKADVSRLTPVVRKGKGTTIEGLVPGQVADFTHPVEMTLKGSNGTTKIYTIYADQTKNYLAELWDLGFDELGELEPDVQGSTYTFFCAQSGADPHSLTPHFKISTGASSSVQAGVPGDFSRPVLIRVTSEDGAMTKVYRVVVDNRKNSEAKLLSFRFAEMKDGLPIAGDLIEFNGEGLNTKHLTPIFSVSPGASVSGLTSGVTSDFSKEVKLKIVSEDGSDEAVYTIRKEAAGGLKFTFEKWNSYSGGSAPNFMNPEGWSTSNKGMATSMSSMHVPDKYPVYQTSDAHGGSYAAAIETVKLDKDTPVGYKSIAAGALFMGKFDESKVLSDPLASTKFGEMWTWSPVKPDHFKGWYKYTPGATLWGPNAGERPGGTDVFSLYAIFYYGPTLTSGQVINGSDRIIAEARISDLSPKSEWTYFDIPFEYKKSIPAGQTLRYSIVASSSKDGGKFIGAPGSLLIVDDLEITGKE